MGYRPPEESLEQPLSDMLNGIEDFNKAVDKRIDSQEYKDEHIKELQDAVLELTKIKFTLVKLKQENW